MSNFVTPSWFDGQAPLGNRFDWMHNCDGPFQMTKGGYVVTMKNGKVSQQFGEEYPDWKKESKKSDLARTARRVKHGSS